MDDVERRSAEDEVTPPPEPVPAESADADLPAPESAPIEAVYMPDMAEADVAMYAPDVLPEPEAEAVAVPEAALDGVQAAAQAAELEPSISEKAKATRRPDGDETRIEVLSLAIERYPDAAVNYVLRGEAWQALGNRAKAREDFRAALALAGEAAERARWGYVDQALADRARDGLRQLGD